MLLLPMWICSPVYGWADNAIDSASMNNNIGRTRLLLAMDVNADKVPPLIHAAFSGQTDVVRALLEKGADVNSKLATSGATALHIASEHGYTEVVKLLVEKGADVNSKRITDGATALVLTSERGHTQVVKLLIENGADVNLKLTTSGATALIIASEHGYAQIVKLLIENGADLNPKRSADGATALVMASEGAHAQVVKLLVEKGADVNSKRITDGATPLLVASFRDDAETVKFLVEKGADVNRTTKGGQTALKVACQTGNDDLVAYLYEKGAHTDFEDSSIEGMDLSGVLHHVLGDYFLAQDNLGRARVAYVKAREYYGKLADRYSGDVTKLAWKQFGIFVLDALVTAAQSYGSSYHANMQSRQLGQISALKYASRTHTGISGYHAYMTKYKQTYFSTRQIANISSLTVPSDKAPLDERKAYAKARAEYYTHLSTSVDKILNCFNTNPNEADLHACVRVVAAPTER